MHPSRIIIVAIVAVVIVVGVIALTAYGGFLKFPSTTTNTHVDRFTIIEEDPPGPLAGMNGSYYKSFSVQWPVIQVQKGDNVIITVINNGTTEPHGFAIDHYYSSGISTAAGQSHVITFVANVVGTFRIYCSIFCSIHPFMQNGALIVTAT